MFEGLMNPEPAEQFSVEVMEKEIASQLEDEETRLTKLLLVRGLVIDQWDVSA